MTAIAVLAFCLPLSAAFVLFAPQDSIERLAAVAEQCESNANWDGAEAAYREILKIDPRSVAALNRLGAIEVRFGRFEEGIRYYKQALDFDPSEFATNLNLGIAYVKKQDYGNAVTPLEQATKANPESFQAQELLGGALVGKNDFLGAVPRLERAFELNPNDVATLYLLERSYLETKQFKKALPTFERLESLDPHSPWVHVLRGQAEDALANREGAIQEFEIARKQLPGDATVRFSLGFLYWKVRRFADAEPEIEQALTLDHEFDEAKYYLADTYILDEKPAKALPLLNDLVKRRPTDARALADQGKALEKLSRDAEAAAAFEASLRSDPERPEVHYQLAHVYKKQKRLSECSRELEIVTKLQQKKRNEQETLLQASGSHRDPMRQEASHLDHRTPSDQNQ